MSSESDSRSGKFSSVIKLMLLLLLITTLSVAQSPPPVAPPGMVEDVAGRSLGAGVSLIPEDPGASSIRGGGARRGPSPAPKVLLDCCRGIMILLVLHKY